MREVLETGDDSIFAKGKGRKGFGALIDAFKRVRMRACVCRAARRVIIVKEINNLLLISNGPVPAVCKQKSRLIKKYGSPTANSHR